MVDYNVTLSVNEFTGDGNTTVWPISFAGGFLNRDHVLADLILAGGVYQPLSFSWIDGSTIKVEPPVPAGQRWRVYRNTPRSSPLLDFSDGAFLTEGNLDTNAKQAVFIAQEAFDRAAYATRGEPGPASSTFTTLAALRALDPALYPSAILASGNAPPVAYAFMQDGVDREYAVVSKEGQAAVQALLNRLAFLRENGDEDLLSMDDVLTALRVPEDNQSDCIDLINDFLNDGNEARVNYQQEPISRDRYRQLRDSLADAYEGSWLERVIITRLMVDDLGAPDLNLQHLAGMVERLAESVGKSEDEIDPQDASGMLSNIAWHIRDYADDDREPAKLAA